MGEDKGLSNAWLEHPLRVPALGHSVMTDTGMWDSIVVARAVPLSPLFFRDLCGRVIYTGYGPERKTNDEWEAYRKRNPDGTLAVDDNPFIPLVVCPRHCEVADEEATGLLEQVLLCHWRPLDMSLGFHGLISGAGRDEDAELVANTYLGANLYPYKLRLDTFYVDGYRLPQTNYVFARGVAQGVNPAQALKLAEEDVLSAWQNREPGLAYEAWVEAQGGEKWRNRLFQQGVTLIPTFEACNGFHVVGRNFELEDYWPGRAVPGLHEVVQQRPDEAPLGTILQVLRPGFVTGSRVVQAQVVISDGSGYVSSNAADPMAFIPNMHLPHQRTLADWRGCWVPTHPEHFEAPALWAWEPETGRFLQASGPLWDPLHYFYGSYEHILAAHDAGNYVDGHHVPVPEQLVGRFWPVMNQMGFDTFDEPSQARRLKDNLRPRSMLKCHAPETLQAGVGYHPMPMEFEFEIEPFWFPEFHPFNRGHGECPAELEERVVPLIQPRVTIEEFVKSLNVPEDAPWCADATRLATPVDDPVQNYPTLARYLLDDLSPQEVVQLCPMPFLSDISDYIAQPVEEWWLDDDGQRLDTLEAWQNVLGSKGAVMYDALWDGRQKMADIVRFRHMLYQTNLPLYTLGWWFGANVPMLQAMMVDWIYNPDGALDGDAGAAQADGTPAGANGMAQADMVDDLSEEERRQLAAIEQMRQARTQRPVQGHGQAAEEDLGPAIRPRNEPL